MKEFIKVNNVIILTILGYCVALMFERGYAKIFNYPFSMITVDIKSLFIAILSVFVFVFVLLLPAILLFKCMLKFNTIVRYIIMFVSFLLLGYIIHFSSWGGTLFGVILILLVSIVGMSCCTDYLLKSLTEPNAPENTSIESYINYFLNYKIVSFISFYIFVFVWVMAVGLSVGRFYAQNINDFFTFQKDNNKYAIIKQYDNTLITAKIIDNKLESKVTYFTTDSLNGLVLNYEVGIARENCNESKK